MNFTGLPFEDIKTLHMSKSYYVYLIGFLPGFPYLGELDSKLFVPRLQKPRASVSASSVGVGVDKQESILSIHPVAGIL